MSHQSRSNNLIDELDEEHEERIIREYEEECANEELLNIKKLAIDESSSGDHKVTNGKFDKCLNISDNEYLENLSLLDIESDRCESANRPLYIDTSIPTFTIDNLNSLTQRCVDNYRELDRFKELNSSNSTINSSQLNDQLNGSSSHQLDNDELSIVYQSNDLSSSTDYPNRLIKRHKKSQIITFEIISARTVIANETINSYVNNSNKFVLYTIILKRSPGLEIQPGILEKRYSDFLRFFIALRRNFEQLFEKFPFPGKVYSNNFESQVIAERSIFFHHLLTFCLSIPILRNSFVFYEFVLHSEFKKCRRLMRDSNFEESTICLENLLFILIKLNRIESTSYLQTNIFITYLALAACLNEIENFKESARYATEAFKMISFNEEFDRNELIIPFLLLSVQLNSRLNRCCKAQNQKLLELNENGVLYERRECLIDLFVLKNYFILTP